MPSRSEVETLLHGFAPADDREADHRDAMLRLLRVDGDPLVRHHFTPGHFTASAFVVSPDGAYVLLILHQKLKLWLQPGGHIESDDLDICTAARRECLEEAGLTDLEQVGTGLFDIDVHTIPANPREPTHLHHDLRFLFRASDQQLKRGDDVDGARWVARDRVAELQSDESVLRAIRKLPT